MEDLRKVKFFLAFFIIGFIMKIIAEMVHEICGHGLFVLLFGGRITNVYISILWPYELSYIGWEFHGVIPPAQKAWIYGAGILVCLVVSFVTQIFLLMKTSHMVYHASVLLAGFLELHKLNGLPHS